MIAFLADLWRSLTHVHTWTKWEDGGIVRYFDPLYSGTIPTAIKVRQSRRCETCGELERRER